MQHRLATLRQQRVVRAHEPGAAAVVVGRTAEGHVQREQGEVLVYGQAVRARRGVVAVGAA